MKVLKMKERKQEGQTSCEVGIARRFGNEEEEESWQEGDQMAEQWEEEQKLEAIVERRRTEGSFSSLDAMQKVPELVVSERMSQGQRVKSPKEKKKIPDGLSKR